MRDRDRILSSFVALAFALFLWCAEARADERLEKGKKLYLLKCAKCHKLYDPTAYDDAAWAKWMGKMKKKSKLGDENFKQITDYLETIRKK